MREKKCKTCVYDLKTQQSTCSFSYQDLEDFTCYVPKIKNGNIVWNSCYNLLPKDSWLAEPDSRFSKEKLVANSATIALAFYDREKGNWYTGCPAKNEGWIDKIRYWADIPINPVTGHCD